MQKSQKSSFEIEDFLEILLFSKSNFIKANGYKLYILGTSVRVYISDF